MLALSRTKGLTGGDDMADFDAAYKEFKDQLPFPVVKFAEKLGIKVFVTQKFPDKKSGEIKKKDGEYCIFINGKHSYERNRFTLAHELAHYKLHKDILDKDSSITDFVGETSAITLSRDKSQTRDSQEIEADQLAADILMPEDEFVRVWNEKNTAMEVASVFAVSKTAAQIRAQTLRAKYTNAQTSTKTV